MKKTGFLILLTLVAFLRATAQDEAQSLEVSNNIFDSLRTPDPQTGATVVVVQDDKIANILKQRATGSALKGSVYRVQVFSSNNQRSAKTDAFKIEQKLKEYFPYENIQVNYASPFWKVRIGEFATREEATQLMAEVADVLPERKNQIYIIAERIK